MGPFRHSYCCLSFVEMPSAGLLSLPRQFCRSSPDPAGRRAGYNLPFPEVLPRKGTQSGFKWSRMHSSQPTALIACSGLASPLCGLRSRNHLTLHLFYQSAQLYWVGENHAHNPLSLLARLLHVWGPCPVHDNSPFKKVSLGYPTAVLSHCLAFHIHHFSKKSRVYHNHG